ncbi:TPA: hypothetical protein SL836_003082 [Pseudomonas aeruginosa]|uniref:hypothetical protein n=1 Tax=Pseudomonas aeruginosa TaxID=287 RepID=UPI0012AC1901|nr:hypothetical protein [Pseudomonas aeruginosa]EKU2273752.1 hypothetical protein [Pseudomonas aeruginosa]ELO0933411.1 hypothetical protein [Pseudomonas aeruginosa]MBG5715283.1 hypothetical protein [Pseudomonas aeruginosa]MCS8327686.1 hypothetical protein [Pseudomonas aeruginosa]MCU9352419.1 hypothetical protein [Pseudomonas aeruginosa]
MSIDWDKANGSAVAALIAKKNNIHYPGFEFVSGYHRTGCMIRATSADDGSPLSAPEDVWEIVERPVTWNGQGLPPVGTVCEYRCNDSCEPNDWTAVHVLAHAAHGSDTAMLLAEDNNGEPGTIYGRIWVPGTCRPLRTPEQIAAEEREKAIDAMLDLDPPHEKGFGLTSRRQFCEVLFDAGYRRQEEGK